MINPRFFLILALPLFFLFDSLYAQQTPGITYSENSHIRLGSALDIVYPADAKRDCLEFTDENINWVDGDGARSWMDVSLATSFESLSEYFGYDIAFSSSADVNVGVVSVQGSNSFETRYKKFTERQSETLALIVGAQARYGRQQLINESIFPEFQQLVEAENFDEFRQRCGTHYVDSQQRASKIAAVLVIENLNSSTKRLLEAKYSSQFSGAFQMKVGVKVEAKLDASYTEFMEYASRLGNVRLEFEYQGIPNLGELGQVLGRVSERDLNAIVSALSDAISSSTRDTSVPVRYQFASFENFGAENSQFDPDRLKTISALYSKLASTSKEIARLEKLQRESADRDYYATIYSMRVIYRDSVVTKIRGCLDKEKECSAVEDEEEVYWPEDMIIPHSISADCAYPILTTGDSPEEGQLVREAVVLARGHYRPSVNVGAVSFKGFYLDSHGRQHEVSDAVVESEMRFGSASDIAEEQYGRAVKRFLHQLDYVSFYRPGRKASKIDLNEVNQKYEDLRSRQYFLEIENDVGKATFYFGRPDLSECSKRFKNENL